MGEMFHSHPFSWGRKILRASDACVKKEETSKTEGVNRPQVLHHLQSLLVPHCVLLHQLDAFVLHLYIQLIFSGSLKHWHYQSCVDLPLAMVADLAREEHHFSGKRQAGAQRLKQKYMAYCRRPEPRKQFHFSYYLPEVRERERERERG